jgi:hypothetical protein
MNEVSKHDNQAESLFAIYFLLNEDSRESVEFFKFYHRQRNSYAGLKNIRSEF